MTAGVRRLPGPVEFVDVGVECWAKNHRRSDGDPIGGIVLAVTEKFDEDSGEIDRSFLVVDPYVTQPYLRWTNLREVDVDRNNLNQPEHAILWRLWRRMAEAIVFSRPHVRRRGAAVADEVRLARGIVTLQEQIFGDGGVFYAVLDKPVRQEPAVREQAPVNVSALVD